MQGLEGVLGVMTGLAAVVLGIGVAFWGIYWDHQKKRLQYQERQLMIERGLTPPPDLPNAKKIVTPEDCLRRGTILLFLGVGFGIGYVVLANASGDGPPAWLAGVAGAIVGFLGLGNLVYYFLARNRRPEESRKVID